MKVRVIRKNSLYYVQHKVLCFWVNTFYNRYHEYMSFTDKDRAIYEAKEYLSSFDKAKGIGETVWESE